MSPKFELLNQMYSKQKLEFQYSFTFYAQFVQSYRLFKSLQNTTNKLQTKKNILEDHEVNINYNIIFLINFKLMLTRHSSSLYAVVDVHVVTA